MSHNWVTCWHRKAIIDLEVEMRQEGGLAAKLWLCGTSFCNGSWITAAVHLSAAAAAAQLVYNRESYLRCA